jgi:hypothetical protein
VSGTSALVVDFQDPTREERPDVETLADEFVEASVKYFWPAIYRGELRVTVETSDETVVADVDEVPSVRPFVECYESRFEEKESPLAPGDVAGLDVPVRLPPRSDGTETPRGTVRLAARLASPADDDTHLNEVALFRGTGMVVKYYDQSRIAYADRDFYGVLAAGEARAAASPTEGDLELDRFLRFAEPPEHDEWESTENLRDHYQRGFRTALDEMFGTLRDGLRHLIAKSDSDSTLSDNVLSRFPIHGGGSPRGIVSPDEPAFEIDSSSRFDGHQWRFSGRIATTYEEFEGWTAEVSLTGVGEDGSRYDEIPVENISTDVSSVRTVVEDGVARLIADRSADTVEFEGRARPSSSDVPAEGKIGETQLEIRAELETVEESH